MIQIDAVALVCIFVECVLYGISLVLYSFAVIVLLRRRKTNGLNKPMFAAIIVMFTLGTIHVSVDLRRLMIAFLYSPLGAKKYLQEISTHLYLVRSTAYVAQTLTGDGFVLYRLYLVWNADRRVIYPLFLAFLADVAIGIVALHNIALASLNALIFVSKRWIATFYGMTLFTNIGGSSLLAYRIWRTSRNTSQLSATAGDRRVMTAAIIVIESGAIYSICLTLLLTLYLCGTFAQYVFIDTAAQIVGVVFSLIIVRVGLGLTSDAAGANQGAAPSLLPSSARTSSRRRVGTDTFGTDPPQVQMTKVTHDDGGRQLPPGPDSFQSLSMPDEKEVSFSVTLGGSPC